MNPTFHPGSRVPWPTSDDRVRVPDTPAPPDSAPAAPLRTPRDAWTQGLRSTVRGHPLAAVATAAALGAVIARLTR